MDGSGGDRLALAVLAQYRMATTEQLHLLTAPGVRIEQTRRRLMKLRAEGLVDRITLAQAHADRGGDRLAAARGQGPGDKSKDVVEGRGARAGPVGGVLQQAPQRTHRRAGAGPVPSRIMYPVGVVWAAAGHPDGMTRAEWRRGGRSG
ncbi:replication-relaxation family protein [Streptomyces sp. NEAU-W12]|uniref:replication-relaxation family protein n=1 Tax=Streptomyces sp. NEAU-W12 TaxID=2994668 RepID=UPI00224B5ECC|nr:replication-relaxation family protein [Streptomyces sp. NEAU-W12]MCX2923117.1 replication-relaxation family protein [Streptomyces sp. NEAU-W12]